MRKVLAAAAVALLSGEAVLADSAADAARAELARERRRLSSDDARLAEVSRSLEASLSELAEVLERVDSKLGFSAIYYGRLTRDGSSITGTWESTTFGLGDPGSGRWRAVREEEREDTP